MYVPRGSREDSSCTGLMSLPRFFQVQPRIQLIVLSAASFQEKKPRWHNDFIRILIIGDIDNCVIELVCSIYL